MNMLFIDRSIHHMHTHTHAHTHVCMHTYMFAHTMICTGSMLLESKVLSDRVYQKQQETLIVWTENESMDLALSFQEKTGCNDLWAKICDVRMHLHVCKCNQ